MLADPPLCSAIEAASVELDSAFCHVAPAIAKPGQHEVTLSLTATTSPVHVGGYRLAETDNYNGGYLPPTVELKPGDTFKVRLLNALAPAASLATAPTGAGHHGSGRETNLHTHGLIVSARNARPELPQNGDNVFVQLDRGKSFDYSIDIPTNLPASILDGASGIIPHPSGPFWYHSHQHGTSAMQVSGGMSGLLSIGPAKVNLVATKAQHTTSLKDRTDARYLMLRDIKIQSAIDPEAADGQSPAIWLKNADDTLCGPGAGGGAVPVGGEGYCRDPNDKQKLWLFTVNGQRFPTIKIPSGRNGLWRLANLSADATYGISLRDAAGNPVPFDLLSIDGVPPGTPNNPATTPSDSPEATKIKTSLRLMPAGRAEIFIENDNNVATERRLVLQTDGINTVAPGEAAGDKWPKIKLAEVILEAAPVALATVARVGLNLPVAKTAPPGPAAGGAAGPPAALPTGCVRDIDRSVREHRRITFQGSPAGGWTIKTELVRPTIASGEQPYSDLVAASSETISAGFEKYLKDGVVDWEATGGRPRHTCVRLTNGHAQLWALVNPTAELHNFHLHQTKFRLATETELKAHGIDPSSIELQSGLASKAPGSSGTTDRDVWHDTLPIEGGGGKGSTVFIIINFDAEEQLGRYVYHCHILKHEDAGLMAPMRVIN
jgi:FtsP/CotA-like multicopper oxidase with cupredoxin domain